MPSFDELVAKIEARMKEQLRRENRLEEQKVTAELGFGLKHGKISGPWIAPLPGGKDNRPAEKLVKGKVRGKRKSNGPGISM